MIFKLTLWAMEHQIAHTVVNINDVIRVILVYALYGLLIGTKSL